MATKDVERKALEQIKAIIAKLGTDSYVGAAFTGCFSLAEQNIENDFLISMEQRVEEAEEKAKREQKRAEDWAKSSREIKDKWRSAENELSKLNEGFVELENRCGVLEQNSNTKDYEIVLLKARLFDLMEKGEE